MRKIAGVLIGVLFAAAAFSVGGADAAATDLVVTGKGEGAEPNVRTFGPTGGDGGVSYNANGTSSSGVRVAAGDITGDGTPEIITGTGPGVNGQVQVWSKDGQTLVAQVNPFPGFTGGIFVAAANEDETPGQEVIVAAGPGGGPHVKVLRLVSGQLQTIYSFYAYDAAFRGGVYVAASGGRIITGPGAGGGPHVRVFRIFNNELSVANEWMAYAIGFTGGVHVAAGALRSPTTVDIATGAGPGGGPHVKLWSLDGMEGPGLMAFDPGFRGGARVAIGQNQRLITGAGAGGGPHVYIRSFNGTNNTFPVVASFFAYGASFNGGVWVGGFPLTTTPPTTTTACVGVPPLCLPGGETTTTTSSTSTTVPTTTTSSTSTSTTSTSTTSTSTTTSTTSAGLGLPLP